MAILEELAAAGTPYVVSSAVENSHVVVDHQAVLYGFDGRNTDTGNGAFIMVFDATSLPANGTKPVICVGVGTANASDPSQGNFGYNPGSSYGIRFIHGIVIAASSTDANTGLTVLTSSKVYFHVDYASEDGLSSS